MPIERKLLWVIVATLVCLTTSCNAISAAGIAATGSNTGGQGPTVEVRGRTYDDKNFVPSSVTVHVTFGNVIVSVVEPADANHVVILAKDVMLADNLVESKFISDTINFNLNGAEVVEVTPGEGVPKLDVHIYVRKNVPLKIEADNGDVRIYGSTGAVTARAIGSIEVRDATENLNLTAQGENHNITVDGAHKQLTLHADKGSIEVTADDVSLNTSTGAGDILFVGRLLSGASYFTTTSNSNITVLMPRYDIYAIDASTTANTIAVQYPAMAEGSNQGNPVCGTFNSGSPYVIQADDSAYESRGQVTINRGDPRSAGPARLIGLVTPDYFVFHSTVRNVLLQLPRTNEFFPETLPDNPVSAPPVATGQSPTATLQSPGTPMQSAAISPEAMNSFMGTPAAAIELPAGQLHPTRSPATGGSLMYSVHCPVKDRRTERVKIFATSNGGNIRIYQNLP
jgi:hypothetical protein